MWDTDATELTSAVVGDRLRSGRTMIRTTRARGRPPDESSARCRDRRGGFDIYGERHPPGVPVEGESTDMKYMLMIYGNDELWSSFAEDEMAAVIRETDAQLRALRESGELVGAYGVGDQDIAKLVRSRAGETSVTDGPYIETKEYLGSFTIVDVEDEARALEIAASNPAARLLQVEVRPLMHESDSNP